MLRRAARPHPNPPSQAGEGAKAEYPPPLAGEGEGGGVPLFSARVLNWYDCHGRKDLPWQQSRSAYRVWVSEIMLQQTQVATVVPYFLRFVERFPDVRTLAAASSDAVLQHWAGLGYYARARNLHRAAQIVVTQHGGEFPREFEAMQALPGIGRSTAGAILAQAFGQRHAILDGNVKRLLSRYHAIAGWPGDAAVAARLWQQAELHTPAQRADDYTQGIMDLGATVCARRPDCPRCPLQTDCVAFKRKQTLNYPQSRPRKLRPLRETCLLILERNDGRVLLERRPASGIWGGLWSLPELPLEQAAAAHCRERFGVKTGMAQELGRLRHGFTHFELDIRPLHLKVRGVTRDDRDDRCWYLFTQPAQALGLPAPVKRLLDSLASQLVVRESAA